MNKTLIWAITIFLIVAMVCGTVIWINHNAWTFKFEMDDNTKEAIESIEFGEINAKDSCTYDGCNYHCCNDEIGCYSTLLYCNDVNVGVNE